MAERAHDPRSLGIDQASPAPLAVPKLCQNPICLGCRELLFEREQLPQVVDNRHFRIEPTECLEPVIVLRNQQVAGSSPAGGYPLAPISTSEIFVSRSNLRLSQSFE